MDEREPVQIGVDLRPLPLQVGDDIWYFNPDPGKEFFAELTAVDELDANNAAAVVDAMYAALIKAVQQEQRDDFLSKGYGLRVLTGISQALNKELTNLPTEPSSDSGKAPGAGGGSKS